ncbi:MAG: pyroglutamyl peptidase [Carbonactinosporaceae bacterium]
MRPTPPLVRTAAAAAAGLVLAGLATAGAAQAAQPAEGESTTASPCLDDDLPVTVEESRLAVPTVPGGRPASGQLLDAGGFTDLVERFEERLCGAPSVAAAGRLAARQGDLLWGTAVDRAQGRRPGMGSIDRYDDRPLYWAHLSATAALRQWDPVFEVSADDRTALVREFRYHARGVTDTAFPRASDSGAPDGTKVTRVLVSGFDPFRLENEPRRSNPSGAAALQLDGRRFVTDDGVIVVQAVMLPVTWSGFDDGIVEDAFGRHLRGASAQRADLIMTISQGGRGVMDIEQWAGRWRGGSPDNNLEGEPEVIPENPSWPMPAPPPEFIETSLPHQEMIDAGTGPWPVEFDRTLCEWPPGTFPDPDAVVCHDDGPTPGSRARSGSGGSFLSNESMYRSNRVRIGLGAVDVPGGHLHISELVYPDDPAVLIDEAFQSDRQVTVEQTVALVRAAGQAQARQGGKQ